MCPMQASKFNHSKIGGRVGNAVVIKSGRARLIDPKTGADRGSVGSANPVAAASDGQFIVIAYAEGYARRYCAATGAERGSVGEPNVSGCSISGGVIILTYAHGGARRYDAVSGAGRGSV